MSQEAEIDHFYDHITQQMVVDLRTRVLAYNFENHKKTVKLEIDFVQPATWWDALKQEKMPDWFTRRIPIRTKTTTKSSRRTVSFKKYATYPDTPPLPRRGWFWPCGYESFISEDDD